MLKYVSLQQYLAGYSHNTNNGMRAVDGSGDTIGVQEKAPSRDSHNINNSMRAVDGPGDTLGLQEKAPSRGMRCMVHDTNIFHVHTRNTSSPTRTHTL